MHALIDCLKIVSRESAILDYPDEQSNGLHADHHSIVKFPNTADANYTHIRDTLRMLTKSLVGMNPNIEKTHQSVQSPERLPSKGQRRSFLMKVLGVPDNTDDDLRFLNDRKLLGSCEWIHSKPSFQAWIGEQKTDADARLWITGRPGSGTFLFIPPIIPC